MYIVGVVSLLAFDTPILLLSIVAIAAMRSFHMLSWALYLLIQCLLLTMCFLSVRPLYSNRLFVINENGMQNVLPLSWTDGSFPRADSQLAPLAVHVDTDGNPLPALTSLAPPRAIEDVIDQEEETEPASLLRDPKWWVPLRPKAPGEERRYSECSLPRCEVTNADRELNQSIP